MATTHDHPRWFDDDEVESLVAFKTWRIIEGRLQSRYVPVSWESPVLEAECHRHMPTAFRSSSRHLDASHAAPHPLCACGIHADATPDLRAPKVDFRAVTGIVLLWDGVLDATGGMLRAGAARVCALGLYAHAGRRQREAVTAVAAQMEADLIDLRELHSAADHYARILVARVAGVRA